MNRIKAGFSGLYKSPKINSKQKVFSSINSIKTSHMVKYHANHNDFISYHFDVTGENVSTYVAENIFVIAYGEIYQPHLHNLNIDHFLPTQLGNDVSPACIIAQIYARAGSKSINKIEGLFTCLILDKELDRLILFRDSSCNKSLYYHYSSSHGIIFATDLDLFFAWPGFEKKLSKQSIHEYLRFLDVSTPNTIYDGISSVEPSTPLVYENNILRYDVEVDDQIPKIKGNSLGNYAIRVCDLLKNSLAKRISLESSTGFFLSGGIDSSLLCSIGAQLEPSKIDAFTVGFDDPLYDESEIASNIAQYIGIRHHKLRYTWNQYKKFFYSFVANIEYPFADPAGIPTLAAMEDIKEITNVVIDGTGADTLVGMMPPRHKRIAVTVTSLFPPAIRKCVAIALRHIPSFSQYAHIFEYREPQEVLIRWYGWKKDEIEELCREEVSFSHTRFYNIFSSFPLNNHFDRYSALMGNLPDDRLHQAARISGIQVRFPFWDPDVERFIKGLDMCHRYVEGKSKIILRAALSRSVPSKLWDVPKHYFNFPFIKLLEIDNFDLINEFLNEENIKKHGIFDHNIIRVAVSRFIDGDKKLAFKIWGLLILHAWCELHFNKL